MKIDSKDNHHSEQPSWRSCGRLGFMNTQMGVYWDCVDIITNSESMFKTD